MVARRRTHGTGETPADTQREQEQETAGDVTHRISNSGMALLTYVERIERLTEEKKAMADDIKEVFSEIKAQGFDTAVLRKVLSRRAMDSATRAEFDALMDLYEKTIKDAEKAALKASQDAGGD